jgi:hypothetical protein
MRRKGSGGDQNAPIPAQTKATLVVIFCKKITKHFFFKVLSPRYIILISGSERARESRVPKAGHSDPDFSLIQERLY